MTAGASWCRSIRAGLSFRPMVEADLPFSRQVYASTREAELDLVDWSRAQKDAFVGMQFDAQHAHYRLHRPDMDWLVIGVHDAPGGRLYLDRGPTDHAIVDVALLPEHRGKGLGTALLRDILEEAGSIGRPVTIYVETFNPAMRLYRRLGFTHVEQSGVHELMRWTPQANTAS